MTPSKARACRFLAALLVLCALLSTGASGASTVRWTIVVYPAGAGSVVWSTSSPAANGSIDGRRTVTFDNGGFIDLTFEANPGFELTTVYKNLDDWTAHLDGSHHFRFGPVDQAHLIVARYTLIVPTGTFDFTSPDGNPLVPSIVDVTGHYEGVTPTDFRMTPTAFARPYAGDVAMDETGKLDVVGTVEGLEPAGGGEITGMGTVRTVNGTPTARMSGRFAGTRDGVAATCSGSVGGDAELLDIGSGTTGVEGTLSYKGNVEGAPIADRNVPVTTPVDPAKAANLRRSWTLALDIREKPGAGKKKAYVATAVLDLPNGDSVRFPERRAKYSAKRGYSLVFRRGTNVTVQPNALDKRSSVTIRRMTLTQAGMDWVPNGGKLAYKFLGQKGTADLVEFLAD